MNPEFFSNIKIHLLLSDILKKRQFIYGDELAAFQRNFARFTGTRYAVGVGSGTDALVYGLKALSVGPGDEVIVPALGFAATANAVSWVGARPAFVDIEPIFFNIDPNKIEPAISEKTKAILPVHLHGQLAAMDEIASIAKKYNLFIVEDAAQAIGSSYTGKQAGALSNLACFSFSPTKILGCLGDGGGIITNDRKLAEKAIMLRSYGARPDEVYFRHDSIGTSSRLDNFQAGVLNIRMEFLDKLIARYRENCDFYREFLEGAGDLTMPAEDRDRFHNGYRFVVRSQKRDALLDFLRSRGVHAIINYPVSLPHLGAFRFIGHKDGDFSVAEQAAKEVLSLPNSHLLGRKEIERISGLVKEFFKR